MSGGVVWHLMLLLGGPGDVTGSGVEVPWPVLGRELPPDLLHDPFVDGERLPGRWHRVGVDEAALQARYVKRA